MHKRTDPEMETAARAQLPAPRAHFEQLLAASPRGMPTPIEHEVWVNEYEVTSPSDFPPADAAVRGFRFELALVAGNAPGPEGFVCVEPGESSARFERTPLWGRWERRG